MTTTTPLVARKSLGALLQALRKARGLSREQVAALTGLSVNTYGRYERGQAAPNAPTLRAIMGELGAPPADIQRAIDLLGKAKSHGWWSRFTGGNTLVVPDTLVDYVQLEQGSVGIRTFGFGIPGLCHTREYAEAITRAANYLPPEEVEAHVSLRLARQDVIHRGTPLHVVLDEGAVARRVGDDREHLDQLEYLAQLARLPNVTLQVLSYDAGKYAAAVSSDFTLLDLGDADQVVYVESLGTGTFFEGTPVDRYRDVFRDLTAYADTPEDTLRFLEFEVSTERVGS